MKTIIPLIGLGLFLTSLTGFAQEEKETKYLLSGPNKPSISGFGGPIVEFSSIEDEFAVFVGGGGAVLIGQTFFFGGYGEGLTTGHYRYDLSSVVNIQDPKVSMGHGGFWLGYINNSHKAVHLGGSLKIGWGEISLYDDYYNYDPTDYIADDGIFVLIPQFEVEMNLTPWFKLNVAGGYRWVSGIDQKYLNGQGQWVDYYHSSDYSSPVGTISLLFGGFSNR
jgi:hypothetical protein